MKTDINQVAADFDRWRSTRVKRGPTPAVLVAKTVALVEQYPKSQIINQLGINATTLKRWLGSSDLKTDDQFIEISPSKLGLQSITNSTVSTTPSIQADVDLINGVKLSVSGDIDSIAALVLKLKQGDA